MLINVGRALITLTLILLVATATAQTKVVVVPMAGNDLKPLANIVTVATANGDFSDPIAAMASITDAGASNPYLVVIAPGVYDLGSVQLAMQSFVDIAGSGKNITKLLSTASAVTGNVNNPDQGAVLGADNATIRDLAIEVSIAGGTNQTSGIFNNFSGGAAAIRDVIIKVSSTSSGSATGIKGVTGVGAPISNVDIDVSGNNVRGINVGGSVQIIDNASISISGTGSQIGVPTNFNTIILRNSVISSPLDGADAFGTGALRISDSIVDDFIDGDDVRCSFVFTSDGTAYNDFCELPPS